MSAYKRITSLILALVMCIGVFPVLGGAAEVLDSGTCGENLTWTMYGDGLLKISGSGPMTDYTDDSPAPWKSYQVRTLDLSDEITTIGNYAFSECSDLSGELTLPSRLTRIGVGAFEKCDHISGSLSLPETLTSIDIGAFNRCVGLTGELVIPDRVHTIGAVAFQDTRFTGLTLGKNLRNIDVSAFTLCRNITNVTIPASVTYIGDGALGQMSSLTAFEVEDGNTLFSAEDGVLYSADKETLVQYPAGKAGTLTILPTVKTIKALSLSGCSKLTGDLTIPDSVETIGGYAFSRCAGFTGTLRIPDHVERIEVRAFEMCTGLSDVVVSGSVTYLGSWAFSGCINLSKAYFEGNVPDTYTPVSSQTISGPETFFNNCAEGFTIYYLKDAKGWKTPEWNGYPCYPVDSIPGETVPAAGVSLDRSEATISITVQPDGTEIGDELTLTASVTPDNASDKSVTWTTSNPSILAMKSPGVFVAKAPGTSVVTVTTKDGGYTAECAVTVERKNTAGQIKVFTPEENGWPLCNTRAAFGYPNKYAIPMKVWNEVYGVSWKSAGAMIKQLPLKCLAWNGNCFGMSLLAIANFNAQIDLKACSGKDGDCLGEYGWDYIQFDSDEDYYCITYTKDNNNNDFQRIIEKTQIAQYSAEFKKAEVYKSDKKYTDLISFLCSDKRKPLLVNFPDGHSVVIATDEKPEEVEGSPGWYSIKLYDPNSPRQKKDLKNPVSRWYERGDSYLLLNTNNGKWLNQMADEEAAVYGGKFSDIRFYDVSKLGPDFFSKPLSLLVDDISIHFAASEMEIHDSDGNTVFEAKDNSVNWDQSICDYYPRMDSDESDRDQVIGSVDLKITDFTIHTNDSEFAIFKEDGLYVLTSTGESEFTVDAEHDRLSATAYEDAQVNIVVQDGLTEETEDLVHVKADLETGDSFTIDADTISETVLTSDRPIRFETHVVNQAHIITGTTPESPVKPGSHAPEPHTPSPTLPTVIPPMNGLIVGPAQDNRPAREPILSIPGQKIEAPVDGSPSSTINFTDVTPADAFYDSVKYVFENGIMNGISATEFAPYSTLTRAMVVTILYRVEGEPATTFIGTFDDVPSGEWYSEAVEWAAANGIVNGYGDGTFGPAVAVTNEQLAAILNRYAEFKGYPIMNGTVVAGEVSSWAVDNVNWAVAYGILADAVDYTVPAYRYEVAAAIHAFCVNVAK